MIAGDTGTVVEYGDGHVRCVTAAELAGRKYRETLRAMSDEAVAHQLAHGARGGVQRTEIEAEAARRGVRV